MKGDEVKAIREILGWTPGQMAELLAVHATTVYRWEAQGERQIRAEGMAKRVLGWLKFATDASNKEHCITQLRRHMQGEGPISAFAYAVGYGYGLTIFNPWELKP